MLVVCHLSWLVEPELNSADVENIAMFRMRRVPEGSTIASNSVVQIAKRSKIITRLKLSTGTINTDTYVWQANTLTWCSCSDCYAVRKKHGMVR